jgi:hypothetical protein
MNKALKNGMKRKATARTMKDVKYIPNPARVLKSPEFTVLSAIIGATNGKITPRGAMSTCDSVNL